MIKRKRFLILAIVIFISIVIILFYYFVNQSNKVVYPNKNSNQVNVENNLKDVNKFLIEKDKERIKSFLRRRNWDMKTTESGLFYMIEEEGKGKKVNYGDYVKMNYEIRLLDGTLLYSSDSDGMKIIHVGRDEEIKGLHEGLQYLQKGDKAKFIIPPHLAYGLIGDSERIPARAILYYQVEILESSDSEIQP